MEHVDVAIIGGGPAGAAAATAAATNDAETVVIEKGVPRADRADLGPDSTDAAGMLDYWVDIMGIPFEEIPEDIVLQRLDRAEFHGPNKDCTIYSTGIESSYPHLGFTFNRARMDDWLRERAESAGSRYLVGSPVRDVLIDRPSSPRHTVLLADGTEIVSDAVILADGPQRPITLRVLDRLLPDNRPIGDILGPDRANHIAYQEHRKFPADAFEPSVLKFWWGHIPGETAYPWVFPNDDCIARVGLTMPIGQELSAIENPNEYPLLDPSDDRIPSGSTFLRRLLDREYGDAYDIDEEFPLVKDRGKRRGSEAYAISSTRPIDSPTGLNIAVVGGAMGTTSAFHEGGYHVAVRSGTIAGRLAAFDSLNRYNDGWKAAIGSEILRNVAMAKLVRGYGPSDWDREFDIASRMISDGGDSLFRRRFSAGIGATKLILKYNLAKRSYRNHSYIQLRESEYLYNNI